jgi:hypothetical protein
VCFGLGQRHDLTFSWIARGYFGKSQDNLLPGVHLADFEEDLLVAAGAELERKFPAAHSSSALAVIVSHPSGVAAARSSLAGISLASNKRFPIFTVTEACYTSIPDTPLQSVDRGCVNT